MVESPQRQLDEVSRVIGGVEAAVKSMDKYLHDFRHDEANREQIRQGFQDRMLSELAAMRRDIQSDRIKDRAEYAAERVADRAADSAALEKIRQDVAALQAVQHRRQGALGAVEWFMKSPIVGWIVAGGAAVWAAATGRLHL